MGYRSEVALAVSKEAMPHFLGVLAKEPNTRSLIFKHHDHLDQNYNGEGTMLVVWHDIKWYGGCAEIDAINNFVEACESDMIEGFELEKDGYQGDHVRFIRLGEEADDIVEKGTLHGWDLVTTRSLSY
jgi:hypothetical protein